MNSMFYINTVRSLYQIWQEAKLPRPALNTLIHKRLKAILVSAYQYVPYYREIMHSAGYDPIRNYCGPEDLTKLPITTKDIIKKNKITEFVKKGTDFSRCYTVTTSGTTGIPLRIYQNSYEVAIRTAKAARVAFTNGYFPHYKIMAPVSTAKMSRGHFLQRLGLFRKLTIDYTRRSAAEMVDVFLDYKPDLLYGNRSHLDLMALELKRRQIPPEEVRLKLLMTGAEVLHASNRRLLREQFGVEPLDGYGSLELGLLAYETLTHDGLHLFENLDYYEFLDNDGNPVPPGTPGRIVVTALTRTLMPFIRYAQGDLAIFKYEDDAEGNTIRKITRIIGRETIYIQLPDGTKCSSYIFLRILEKYIGIVQFRTIQRTINLFEVLVAAEPSYFLSIRDNLFHDLQQHFPPTVHFKITRVDKLEPDPTGKLKAFVSEID